MFISFLYISLQNKFVVKMEFNEYGILNPGIHKMTWEEFCDFFTSPSIYSERRVELLKGLKQVVDILRKIENIRIYIDGSFVTNKLDPGDWDACFDCSISQIYNLLKKYPLFDRNEQKKLYKGELFFATDEADGFGHTFLEFFQRMRGNSAIKKGIVELIR